MKIKLLQTYNKLEEIREEWNLLASSDSRDGFFRTAECVIAWFKHIATTAEPYVITVRDSDNKLLGIAPLCKIDFRDAGFKIKTVTFAGREIVSGDFLDFIALPQHRPIVIDSVLKFIWAQKDSWSMLQLGELITDGDLHMAAKAWGKENKLPIRSQEWRICPFIDLPQSFDDFLDSLNKSMRYQIRRRERDILIKSQCTITECHDFNEIAQGLDILTELHAARWQSVNQPGNLDKLEFQQFLHEICTTPPGNGKCRLYILKHGEKAVAALLAFHYGDSALYYQAGWDPESPVSRFSPGVVLMARAIKEAISSKLRYFEFLRGDEAYKLKWTGTSRNTTTLLFGKSLMARSYLKIMSGKDSIKPLIQKNTGE